jgi:hypothetical protein
MTDRGPLVSTGDVLDDVQCLRDGLRDARCDSASRRSISYAQLTALYDLPQVS